MSDSQSDESQKSLSPRKLRDRRSQHKESPSQSEIGIIIDRIRRKAPKTPVNRKIKRLISSKTQSRARVLRHRTNTSSQLDNESCWEDQPQSSELNRIEKFVHSAKDMESQEGINNLSNQIAALTTLVENMNTRLNKLERPADPLTPRTNETTRRETMANFDDSRFESQVDQRLVQTVKTVKPPVFKGDTAEAVTWLLSFNEVAETNLWSSAMKIRQVSQALELGAKSWYRTTWRGRLPLTWDEFEDEFKTTFLRGSISDHLRMRLSNLKQKPDEDLLQYYFSSIEMCILADAHMPECQQINYVIDGMHPRARASIRMTRPRTILDLQDAIKAWLADHSSNLPHGSNQTSRSNETNNSISRPGRSNDNYQRTCLNCSGKDHSTRGCPKPFDRERVTQARDELYKKREMSHSPQVQDAKARMLAEYCDIAAQEDQVESEDDQKNDSFNRICIKEPPENLHPPANVSIRTIRATSETVISPHKIVCRINGQLEDAVLDTGATITVLPLSLVQITKTDLYQWKWQDVNLANGTDVTPIGWCQASIDYKDRIHTVSAAVLEKAPDVLIGCDYHRQAKLVISYADNLALYHDVYAKVLDEYRQRIAPNTVESAAQTNTASKVRGIQDKVVEASHRIAIEPDTNLYIEHFDPTDKPKRLSISRFNVNQMSEKFTVKSRKRLVIPPRARARLEAKTSVNDEETPYLVETLNNSKLFILPGIGRRRSIMVDVINISKVPVHIERREVIGKATSMDAGEPKDCLSKLEIPTNLTDEQKSELHKLLEKYKDVFVTKNDEIGIVPFIQHQIDTGDAAPIRSKPYRVSIAEQKVIQQLIDEMLQANIIRESRSFWASPVVLVKKKGTSELRFCVDYRKLNKITKVDPYPIPNMDSVLETLSGNHWFSKLDVKAMYWQVLMDNASREKTAFVVHCGQYEFNVMPFGLVSAPMTAMRVMNRVTQGMEDCSFVFYDDILVFTPTFEEHLKQLDKLFNRLEEANIKLNAKKCDLLLKSVHYLGHVVTAQGIEPDPHKVETIRAFPRPKTITDARSFIGMSNFFRRYIKDFALIARPIHETIKINQPFKWTDKAQDAMDTLKAKLMSPPILVHFDLQGDLTIRCDASGFGLGAILMQRSIDPTKSGVIAYDSKTLSKSESNYSTTKKECLAVVYAVKHWRRYLYGKHFDVVTDHHALCWLMQTKDHTNLLMRWALILQEYNFTIKYESGKTHGDADCLSRYPLSDKDNEDVDDDVPTWPIHSVGRSKATAKHPNRVISELAQPVFDIAKEQAHDTFCGPILGQLQRQDLPNKIRKKYKHYLVDASILYRQSRVNSKRLLLVLPKSMREFVLKEAHDQPIGGHFGIKRTLAAIKLRFYWPTLDRDVYAYIKSCDPCQRKKTPRSKKKGFMIPMPIPRQAFEIVGMDLMGPLPPSSNKNQHILVITDYLTKFVIARALRTTTSDKIAEMLRKNVFYTHGLPRVVISDNGANLTSSEIRQMMLSLNIEHKTTSPYRPQTNGQTERYNQVLGTQLAIFAEENPKNWDRFLHALTFAYNTTIHASHGTTPYYLVHGRDPLKPMDLATGRPLYQSNEGDQADEMVTLSKAREFAQVLVKQSQQYSKKRYDSNRVEADFKVNDLVRLLRAPRALAEKKKLHLPWKGPYMIVKIISSVNYQIRAVGDANEELIVHVDQIERYTARITDSGAPREQHQEPMTNQEV